MKGKTQNETIHVGEDLTLFTSKTILNNAKGIVVLVHGLNEHCGRYDHVVSKLNDWGYSVYRYDNRGHGRSGGRRGYIDDFQLFIDDADLIVDRAKAENPGKPVFMLGHSMGGFITACYGVKYKNKLAGQILSGPPTIIMPTVEPLVDFDYKSQSLTMIPNSLGNDVSRDPAVVKAYAEDPLNLKEFTMMLMGEIFIRGMKWLIEKTPSYDYPCLILHGGDDKIVTPDSSRSFYNKIASTDKELKIYSGLYHEIMNEPEKNIVLEDGIHSWLETHI